MLSSLNGVVWMDDRDSALWARCSNSNAENNNVVVDHKDELGSLSNFNFKSMLEVEDDWYLAGNVIQSNPEMSFCENLPDPDGVLMHQHQLDSSTSCSPSSSVFNSIDPSQIQCLLSSKPSFSTLLNAVPNNPLEHGFEVGFLDAQASTMVNRGVGLSTSFADFSSHDQLNASNFCPDPQFHLPQLIDNHSGFGGFDENPGNSLLMKRSQVLKPLETLPSMGEEPTLFQKRAALGKREMGEESERKKLKRKASADWDELEEGSMDDSDEKNKVEGNGMKEKKKGVPAKNLMAERRRRKKLNDRLYMLRSVVPKISKMDRASILGDAIEYLKELVQKINDLHLELETTPPSAVAHNAGFHPLTPTGVKAELCPNSLWSPDGQPAARVEVRAREGRGVNIHMFSARRPGLLVSAMTALDNLGLDVQQAAISCFNGFAMDIFRAEQCKEGQDLQPDQIKSVLLESTGFLNTM